MKKRVRSSVYVTVEVDPTDVIDELNDDECGILAREWGIRSSERKHTGGDFNRHQPNPCRTW